MINILKICWDYYISYSLCGNSVNTCYGWSRLFFLRGERSHHYPTEDQTLSWSICMTEETEEVVVTGNIHLIQMYSKPPPECQRMMRTPACVLKVCLDYFSTTIVENVVCFCFASAADWSPRGCFNFLEKWKKTSYCLDIIQHSFLTALCTLENSKVLRI